MARRILSPNWENTPETMTEERFTQLITDCPKRTRICAIDKTALCKNSDLVDPKFRYWCIEKQDDDVFTNMLKPNETYTFEDFISEAKSHWKEDNDRDDCGIMIFIPAEKDKCKFVPILMVAAYLGFIIK